jgi:chromosomal replication initiator protein
MQAVEYESADQMRAAYSERRARLYRPERESVSRPKTRPLPIVHQSDKALRLPIATPRYAKPPRPRDVLVVSTKNFDAPISMRKAAWKRIVQEVAEARCVSVEEMMGPSHARRVCAARHEAMYRIRSETNLSYAVIAKRMNRADHTTVICGIKSHKKRAGIA